MSDRLPASAPPRAAASSPRALETLRRSINHVDRSTNHANQANSQHSTGPNTEEGKLASCKNNFRYGFAGNFTVLPSEDQEEFDTLSHGLRAEHQPKTVTETLLVEKMAQHFWLSLRAVTLQDLTMGSDLPIRDQESQFALFLRYQTTNDRGFSKCLNDLLKLRAEKRKEQIGFESQRLKQAEEARKQSIENRKQDVHRMDVLLSEAKVDHQLMLTRNVEYSMKRAASEAKAA